MSIQMTEREAADFFAKIGRPMPRDPGKIHAAGVKAVAAELKPMLRAPPKRTTICLAHFHMRVDV